MRFTQNGSKPGLIAHPRTWFNRRAAIRHVTRDSTARSDIAAAVEHETIVEKKTPGENEPTEKKDFGEDLAWQEPALEHGDRNLVDVPEEEVYYPEGGTEAWVVVFGAFCGMFGAFGLLNTVGTFQAYLALNQLKDYSEAQISWIFSIYIFLVFFCGLQIGPIFDSKGPRMLMLAGALLEIVSIMLLGLCTKYWHFILDFSILGGIACSLLFTPAVSSIAHWFSKKRGTATGIAATGGSFGGTIFPLMLTKLLPEIGWAWSTRILGFIFIVLCTLSVLLTRSRLPPKHGATIFPDFRIFRDPAFALATLGVFFLEFGLFVPLTYITPYAIAYGIDQTFSFQLLAIFNGASCFGRFCPGLLADAVGRYNTMLLANAACIITVFALWMPANGHLGLIVAFAVLFGFASGSNISLTPICIGQLCDTNEYGRYYATCYTIVSLSSLTGIPIAGALVSAAGGSYWGLILFTGLCYCASFICFLSVRVGKVGWNPMAVF